MCSLLWSERGAGLRPTSFTPARARGCYAPRLEKNRRAHPRDRRESDPAPRAYQAPAAARGRDGQARRAAPEAARMKSSAPVRLVTSPWTLPSWASGSRRRGPRCSPSCAAPSSTRHVSSAGGRARTAARPARAAAGTSACPSSCSSFDCTPRRDLHPLPSSACIVTNRERSPACTRSSSPRLHRLGALGGRRTGASPRRARRRGPRAALGRAGCVSLFIVFSVAAPRRTRRARAPGRVGCAP